MMSIVEAIVMFGVAAALAALFWKRSNLQGRIVLLTLLIEAFMTAVAVIRQRKGMRKS